MNLNRSTQAHFLRSNNHDCIPALLPYTKMYGNNCKAYSTMQPGLQHALLKHVGYISWIEINPLHMGKHAVVLSEPVAKQSDRLTLIRILEQHVDKLTLVQIGEELAKALFTQGYSVYQIGVERRGGRELSFLTRPLPKKDEEDVRFFWARREGRLLGFTGPHLLLRKNRGLLPQFRSHLFRSSQRDFRLHIVAGHKNISIRG